MSLNYSKEAEKIGSSNWFKPKAGRYTVKFLSEVSDQYPTQIRDKEVMQVRVEVEVNGEVFDWSMGVTQSPSSLYGQVVIVGKAFGSLKDKQINLIVTSDGKKNNYTVEEAVDIQQKLSNPKGDKQ